MTEQTEFVEFELEYPGESAIDLWPRILLLLVIFLSGMYRIALPESLIGNNTHFFEDDLFYYFKIGWNLWEYGFWTLDGITPTNGFHPAWLVVCTVGALPHFLLGLKGLFPYSMLLINLGFIMGAAWVVQGLVAKELPSTKAGVVVGGSVLFGMPFILTGMESGLLVFLCSLYAKEFISGKDEGKAGILAGLIVLARLDALAFVCPILMWMFLGKKRCAVCQGAVVAVMLGTWMVLCRLAVGLWFPASALIKEHWSTVAAKFPEALYKDPYIQEHVIGPSLLGLLVVVAVMFGCWRNRGAMVVASGLLHGFVLLALCWRLNEWGPHRWYLALGVPCSGILVLYFVTRDLKPWAVGLLATVILFGYGIHTRNLKHRIYTEEQWGPVVHKMVKALVADGADKHTLVGSWAAGQLAYYAPFRVRNLEGLTGDGMQVWMITHNRFGYLRDCNYITQWFPDQSVEYFLANQWETFKLERRNLAIKQTIGHQLWEKRMRPLLSAKKQMDPRMGKIMNRGRLRSYATYVIKLNPEQRTGIK
jgi:hypothetical protein